MQMARVGRSLLGIGVAGLLGVVANGCAPSGKSSSSSGLLAGDAATRTYVPPGSYDEYYAFLSGGFSGQVTVYGLPSGRLFKQIPVFSQFPQTGYGYDEDSKAMLNTTFGMVPWDDSHHTEMSLTNGVPDGRWLFINGNNTPRIARIDLKRFETDEILQIPNAAGGHASPFATPDTKYVVSATRFSVPIPQNDVPIDSYKQNFKGTITFVTADKPGNMDVAFQIMMPGYDYDLGHAGKGPSDGWFFFTTYNSEEANTKLEVNASQADKDYIAAINYKRAEACVASGKGKKFGGSYVHNYVDPATRIAKSETKTGVTMLYPADCDGMVYYLPTPKSPHGVDVDPTGEYIVAGGKLATVIPVHSYTKMVKAISDKAFEKTIDGIPVIKYDAVVAGEVKNPGLGPLHTEFDGKGNAYTSMFISSEVVKWKLGTWEVLDRIPVYYSVGHIMIPGGDSKQPWGKYLLALDKITKDRYLPTGPEGSRSAQLIDISGDKMKMLLDFPTMGEPHYAQAVPATLLQPGSVKFQKLAENANPNVTMAEKDGGITRKGKRVDVKMIAIRSHFAPDNFEGIELGDTVYFHVTNIEQDWNIAHGFAVFGANNSGVTLPPGETRTVKWIPQTTGIFPFYCTDFCSALHQEMQGYVRVSSPSLHVPLSSGLSKIAKTQVGRLPALSEHKMSEHKMSEHKMSGDR
jgi:nitrous-oxide reductase